MAIEAGLSVVVEKVGGCLIEPIQRELGYLFCFNSNMQELESGLDQLNATKTDVQAREDGAKRSWKTMGEAANQWIAEADVKISEAETVIKDKAELGKGCFSIKWCPNLKLRFSLGRKGKKLSLVLNNLLQDGRPYMLQQFIDLPASSANSRHDNENDTYFDTRMEPMKEIIDMLLDKETRLIGICGMGGIGKTTFANQLLQKVQDLHLFGFHFMLTVSSNPDFSTIQHLALKELKFNPSSSERVDEKETAQRLRNALDKKKVLIVLDDVWEDFDLTAKGFLLKQSDVESCCKIVYTSRKSDLWSREGNITKQIISLDLLSEEEALNLFRKNVCLGDHDDELLMKKEIEREIVNECGRLPLAIEVVGGALIEKRIYEWNNMLTSLQNHDNDMHIEKINKVLETSYNFLTDPNLKLLFLLCCLFREDQEIPIETLYHYAAGLQLFRGLRDLEHVRNRVYTLVDELIRRCLIINVEAFDDLDRKGERAVKMHDVLRDVGISIARKLENGFSILEYNSVNDLRDTDFREDSKMISIIFQNTDQKFTPQFSDMMKEFSNMSTFRGSKLELQLLRLDIGKRPGIRMSEDFFQGMNHLKVLDINRNFTGSVMPSKLSSLSYLSNLKMLSLVNLDIDDQPTIRHIQRLSSLEILSFRRSFIGALPNEISQLSNLRILDLAGCNCFISKGILSKLTNLQELYMWYGFSYWRVSKEENLPSTSTNEVVDPIDSEEEDNNMTEEEEDEDKYIAAELTELNHLCKLSRLEIEVSNIKQMPRNVALLPSSKLENFRIIIGKRTNAAFRDTIFEGGKRLIWLTDVDDRVFHAFGIIMESKFTDIVLTDCESITTLPPLVNSSRQTSNNKLVGHFRRIEIHRCNQMMYLNDCNKAKIEFNDLETLKFYDLCMMKSFYKGVYEIHFPALKTLELVRLEQFILPTKLKIPRLEKLILESISNLENLCNFLAPSSVKELRIRNCPDLKYVFGENGNKLFEFSNLRTLQLDSLYELTSFVIDEKEKPQRPLFYYDQVSFPCLTNLSIKKLPKISYVVGWNGLQQQEQRYHRANDNERKLQQHVLFPILKDLRLEGLTNLIHIYESNHPNLGEVLAQSLRELRINDCEKLRYLFSESIGRVAAKHLVILDIDNCPMMEVVMKNDDDENDGGTKSISVPNFFPALQELNMKKLPELKRFCDIACSWDLPSLNRLRMSSCPKLETLSPGCVKSPILKSLSYNLYYIQNVAVDINSTIGRLFKKVDDDNGGGDDEGGDNNGSDDGEF